MWTSNSRPKYILERHRLFLLNSWRKEDAPCLIVKVKAAVRVMCNHTTTDFNRANDREMLIEKSVWFVNV